MILFIGLRWVVRRTIDDVPALDEVIDEALIFGAASGDR
jgi:hypothetical protein